jgi:hypothetical protein
MVERFVMGEGMPKNLVTKQGRKVNAMRRRADILGILRGNARLVDDRAGAMW